MRNPEVVVITGASAGVGRATARAFAQRGANIGLLARGRDGLEGARHDVEKPAVRLSWCRRTSPAPNRLKLPQKPLNSVLVPSIFNNAMVSVFSPIKEMTPEEFKRVTEVTYLGYVYGTLAALKRMLPRNRGVIVQVGSALAYRGIPLQAAYCGAKHAVQGFVDSLRCELLHDKAGCV